MNVRDESRTYRAGAAIMRRLKPLLFLWRMNVRDESRTYRARTYLARTSRAGPLGAGTAIMPGLALMPGLKPLLIKAAFCGG
jgi:hypothetical protein